MNTLETHNMQAIDHAADLTTAPPPASSLVRRADSVLR